VQIIEKLRQIRREIGALVSVGRQPRRRIFDMRETAAPIRYAPVDPNLMRDF
jgi:hypothetical protein